MPEHDDAPEWMRKRRRKAATPKDDGPEAPSDTQAGGTTLPEPPPAPVLTVLRLMPSRAHVMCELGEVRNIVCYVRRADLFQKGMTLEGARPRPDLGPRAWEYQGKLPRRRGQW